MTHNPITIKAEIVNLLTSIVEKTISMLENENLTELEFFTKKEAKENGWQFFTNFAYWTYHCCDDTICVYTRKITKINGKWMVYVFDELNGCEDTPYSITEQIVTPYNFEYAVGLYNAIYNRLNHTKHKINFKN